MFKEGDIVKRKDVNPLVIYQIIKIMNNDYILIKPLLDEYKDNDMTFLIKSFNIVICKEYYRKDKIEKLINYEPDNASTITKRLKTFSTEQRGFGESVYDTVYIDKDSIINSYLEDLIQ